MNCYHAIYTDGSEKNYATLTDAENGIRETVAGCNFAVQVDTITDPNGELLFCNWELLLERVTR